MFKGFLLQKMRARYRTYRVSFAVFGTAFFLAFLIGIVFSTWRSMTLPGIDAAEQFSLHWQSRVDGGVFEFAAYGFWTLLPSLLVCMVFGITIYGPFCAFFTVLISAFLLGNYSRLLLGFLHLKSADIDTFFFILGLLPIVFVLLAASSFSSAASFKLFTPKRDDEQGEEVVFGGTLFFAPYFEKTINLRFLLSYLCANLMFALLLYSAVLVQAALVLKL